MLSVENIQLGLKFDIKVNTKESQFDEEQNNPQNQMSAKLQKKI